MNRPPKYIINGKAFSSQIALRRYFQEVLQSCDVGKELDGETLSDCIALFSRHPEFDQKQGSGIESVRVVLNPIFGDRCFWIYRTDGSHTDISYLSCVTAKKPTARKAFMAACRNAIYDQIAAFKRLRFSQNLVIKCEISGRLVSEQDAHVDHFIPFVNLVERFISSRRIDIQSVAIIDKGDGDIVTEFADGDLKKKWQEYHWHNATLQITHKEQNMAKGARIPK